MTKDQQFEAKSFDRLFCWQVGIAHDDFPVMEPPAVPAWKRELFAERDRKSDLIADTIMRVAFLIAVVAFCVAWWRA